ncbi:trehalose synthase [bacterium BMS3Abin15]|nr:trehalose synthase [bacterium BMS3Abin15]HDZ85940.1 glycosyltransferase [Candidatus Moranbacteria bacterium]
MIEEVKIQEKKLADYRKLMPENLKLELKRLAEKLKGKKIVHINTTSREGGGGVAEILHGIVPLMRDLGINASWYTIEPPLKFFEITNKIHNGLQGKGKKLTKAEKDYYLAQSKKLSKHVEKLGAHVYFIHDPQPLALTYFSKKIDPSILRIHIDISNPLQDTWKFLLPYVSDHEKVIVSIHEFINKDLPKKKVVVFPPAIDPLDAKNMPMKKEYARMILENMGINPSKPVIAQVSRLDPFKDPIGVIKAFYIAKKTVPNLQLILLAQNLADDNPYSKKIFEEVKKHTKGDPDIHLFYDPKKMEYENDIIVNAVQIASDIIIQKSTKEGFGLTVTEAMWKGSAVIAGRVGGIKIQIRDGYNGYLVSTINHCASKIVELIKDKKLRHTFGRHAKKSVTENFLLPRLLRDHLKTANEVLK